MTKPGRKLFYHLHHIRSTSILPWLLVNIIANNCDIYANELKLLATMFALNKVKTNQLAMFALNKVKTN